MKLLSLLLSVSFLALAQPTLTVSGPSGNTKAGSTVNLAVAISGTSGTGDQAVQFSLSGITWPIVPTAGAATTAAGKALTCALVGVSYNCIVAGGAATLGDGTIASLQVTLPKSAASGTVSIALSNQLAAATDGQGFVIAGGVTAAAPFAFAITSACDISGDGKVDATDTGMAVLQALGVGACSSDLNSDGKCNILDVQIVAAASVNGFCAAK